MHAVHTISGRVLWANLHLLFWLSLIPFVSGWMGENHFATLPVAAYGFVLFMCSVAYAVLVRSLSHVHDNTLLIEAIGSDRKGKLSVVLYLSGIALSFVHSWIGFAVYSVAAVIWLIPDTRLERRLSQAHH